MGMVTLIYGVIEEYNLTQLKNEEIYKHNARVISNLPTAASDSWPPLSKEMFSITKNSALEVGSNLEYQGRLIHFGACLKSVEHEWPEWKLKFESLLTKLQWHQAHVHFKTEYTEVISFNWNVDLKKIQTSTNHIQPITKAYWSFEDVDHWES